MMLFQVCRCDRWRRDEYSIIVSRNLAANAVMAMCDESSISGNECIMKRKYYGRVMSIKEISKIAKCSMLPSYFNGECGVCQNEISTVALYVIKFSPAL
jgi:hypothetical protein